METNDRLRTFYEWSPEALPKEYTLDLMPLSVAPSLPSYTARCIISRIVDDDYTGEEHVIIYGGQGYGSTPDEAQYDAYKRGVFFLTFGYLPPPTFIIDEPEDIEPVHVNGLEVIPELE